MFVLLKRYETQQDVLVNLSRVRFIEAWPSMVRMYFGRVAYVDITIDTKDVAALCKWLNEEVSHDRS